MEVTAAVVREHGATVHPRDLHLDGPQPDEVSVRVVAAGICHTDVAVQHGHIPVPLPAVLGHEGAGIVEAAGADVVVTSAPATHVIMSQALCGHCRRCLGGEPAYCEQAAVLSLGGRREDGSPRSATVAARSRATSSGSRPSPRTPSSKPATCTP